MHTRRDFLRGLAALTGVTAGSSLLLDRRALAQQAVDPRFLIVVCATGGGSIIDGPLAISASESTTPDTLNTFPDALVTRWDDSPFRAVDQSGSAVGSIPAPWSTSPSTFVTRHRQDMMVATWQRTSVNHAIGQRRAITGNEAWSGRTLQELVAWQYGIESPIPNVHLLAGTGYNDPGTDDLIPSWARGQIVADPITWPLSLDGRRGTPYPMNKELMEAIRRHRNDQFDPSTRFAQVFANAPRLVHWTDIRGASQSRIEDLELITRLTMVPDSTQTPLSEYGLESSPAAAQVRSVFPDYLFDPLHAQAALAFLLLKYRVSVSVTLGPNFDPVLTPTEEGDGLGNNSVRNPPLAFDSSHQGHRSGQAVVWNRLYTMIDGLISLLSSEDFGDGTSLWDRTLIYVASDFGREKHRPSGAMDWGTGHHLNNGVLTVSPLAAGNTLLGGVDPDTALTYGFDPATGAPRTDRNATEAEVFSGLLGALGVDTEGSGLPDVPVMRRS